jgi:hypothetical protein
LEPLNKQSLAWQNENASISEVIPAIVILIGEKHLGILTCKFI